MPLMNFRLEGLRERAKLFPPENLRVVGLGEGAKPFSPEFRGGWLGERRSPTQLRGGAQGLSYLSYIYIYMYIHIEIVCVCCTYVDTYILMCGALPPTLDTICRHSARLLGAVCRHSARKIIDFGGSGKVL